MPNAESNGCRSSTCTFSVTLCPGASGSLATAKSRIDDSTLATVSKSCVMPSSASGISSDKAGLPRAKGR